MSRNCRHLMVFAFVVSSSVPVHAALKDPEAFLGHPIGQDRELLSWEQIVDYMRYVAGESDRAEMIELGRSTLDRPFVMMVLSDAEGVAEQGRYRDQVRELYQVDSTTEARAREIAEGGKAIVAFSLGVHSTEVGAPQASLEMVYAIVSDESLRGREIRKKLLVLIVPSMNPDGLEIVREWYERTKGTGAEGSRPLDLYHPYAGHDNNRDGFFNNLVETSYWSRMLYHDWLPQMIVDEHQMGTDGPRLFLPPFDDPVSTSVHPLVYSQLAAAGQQVVSDLTALGHEGIATQTIFTAEWPGSVRSTGFWHNMLGILSEVASARLATPLHFAPGSLRAGGRGLSEYERRTNFLEPWAGGWWRLRDIIDLELDLTQGFLHWAAQHRSDLLLNFWQMNRDAVDSGRNQAPFGFVIPREAQDDRASAPRLVEILRAGGVEVDYVVSDLNFGDYRVEGGGWVVRADQPFRPFLLEMLGQVDYPMVRDDSGKVIRPYDVTAWSLPLLLGAKVLPVNDRASLSAMDLGRSMDQDTAAVIPTTGRLRLSARDLRSFGDANRLMSAGVEVRRIVSGDSSQLGDFIVDAADVASHQFSLKSESWQALPSATAAVSTIALRAPRVGIFAPFGGSMDEGWTRLILERHGFSVRRIRPGQPELADPKDGERLRQRMDVLVIPAIGTKELNQGRQVEGQARMQDALWAEEYRRGLGGPEAGAALKAFVAAGGTLVVFNHAVPWAVENMGLPVEVGLDGIDQDLFFAPGTLVRATLDIEQPVAWGMPREAALYFASGYTLRPLPWPQETGVVATYSDSDVRLSGFLQGAEWLEGRPALVDIPLQDGRVILFGFSPQRRAQTEGTFKLVFNSILRAGAD